MYYRFDDLSNVLVNPLNMLSSKLLLFEAKWSHTFEGQYGGHRGDARQQQRIHPQEQGLEQGWTGGTTTVRQLLGHDWRQHRHERHRVHWEHPRIRDIFVDTAAPDNTADAATCSDTTTSHVRSGHVHVHVHARTGHVRSGHVRRPDTGTR